MEKITKEAVFEVCETVPRMRCFREHSGLKKDKVSPTFSFPAIASAKKIFEEQTGINLLYNSNYKNYWKYVNNSEIKTIEAWIQKQGDLIFLRDGLSLSVALGKNLVVAPDSDIKNKLPRTELGELVFQCKRDRDNNALTQLADKITEKINSLPFFKTADLICSVPPHPSKGYDLPSSVASIVSSKTGKQNITDGFVFGGTKKPIKEASIDKKWAVWEGAQLSFQNFDVNNKTIVLLDDIYQSGITIQFIAMTLQQAGASEIYGISLEKTLRNSDNV